MNASLQIAAPGQIKLIGTLDFNTVAQLWPQLLDQLEQGAAVHLSLADVDQANSAALALLLEARQAAQRKGVALHIADLPPRLRDLAKLSNADPLLDA